MIFLIFFYFSLLYSFSHSLSSSSIPSSSLPLFRLPSLSFDEYISTKDSLSLQYNLSKIVPLTIDSISKGFLTRNPLQNPSLPPFYSLFLSKLSTGGVNNTVNILVTGGSFTAGNGIGPRNQIPILRWPTQFINWLRSSYPNTTIQLINYAIGSTTSCLALKNIQDTPNPIDLVLVDHSLRDHMDSYLLSHVIEEIIRETLQRKIALLILSERMYDNFTELAYSRVTSQYQIPLLSYRLSVINQIDLRYHGIRGKNYSDLWKSPLSYPHPSKETHYYFAKYLSLYLTVMIQSYNELINSLLHPTEYSHSLPPPMINISLSSFSSSSSSSSLSILIDYCTNPTFEASSLLDSEAHSSTFLPYQSSRYHYSGWNYTRDRSDKPFGWIAGNSQKSLTRTSSKLLFEIVMIKGELSITYLSSSENAGILEIYMASPEWTKGINRMTGSDVFGCCNQSKVNEMKEYNLGQISNSAWLDTYHSPNSNLGTQTKSPVKAGKNTKGPEPYSEIKVKTFRFSYTGNVVVILEHHPLKDEEWKRRNGDKVKILGLRGC